MYWLVCSFKRGNLPEEIVIALDIKANNVRRVVPKQGNNITIDLTLSYLRMFGDSLALIDLKNHNKEIKVWVMKEENGVKSSWIKIMTIPRRGLLRRLFVPLSLTKNGQLVTLHNRLTLAKWSREQGKREEGRKFHGYDMKHFRFAATPVYTETLLSLPSTQ
ncbi:hypothetical protein K1719_000105 [Acacia pycnantha]|nr:hypothetical protein K1719_000105 [Acacia pycnantha]